MSSSNIMTFFDLVFRLEIFQIFLITVDGVRTDGFFNYAFFCQKYKNERKLRLIRGFYFDKFFIAKKPFYLRVIIIISHKFSIP